MTSDFSSRFILLAVLALLGVPVAGETAVSASGPDTALAQRTTSDRPCGVCHSKPDFSRLDYDRWSSLIKLVPAGMMPVKGDEERSKVLEAIRTDRTNGFYRSRCSNCHDLPDPATLEHNDWRGRLFKLTGLEMPVMSSQTKRTVLEDLAEAHGRRSDYDVTADWFELPDTRRDAPVPENLKFITKDSVLLLHFWSPGCQPCRDELPEFKDFVQSVPDTVPLRIRIVATTTKRQTTREMLDPIHDGRLLFDADKTLTNRLKVGSFPTNYLIARDGKFLARMIGRRPWHRSEYRRELYELIQNSPTGDSKGE